MSDTSANHLSNPTPLQKSNLTFGVEVEFALVALEGIEDPHPDDTRLAYGIDYNPQKYDLANPTAKAHPIKNPYTLKEESKRDSGYNSLKEWEEYMREPPVWPVVMSEGIQRQWDEWAAQEDEIQPEWATNVAWAPPIPAQETWYQNQHGRGVRHAQEHIVNTLSQAGFPARMGGKNDTPDIISYNWIVTLDKTIVGDHLLDDKYVKVPIEITSPPYSLTAKNIRRVRQVCRLLTSTYRININGSCGLHVHIGQGNKGFSFDTIRNLFAVLWTFEPQINTLHPVHRLKNIHFAYNLRTDSDIASMCLTPLQSLEKLGGVGNSVGVEDEQECFGLVGSSTGYKAAYNTKYIRKPYKHAYKRTIEFRQHEGTLDPERIENWIQVCAGLVLYAANKDRKGLTEVLKEMIGYSVERFPIQEVLRFLDLEDQARFYGDRLMKWEFGGAEGGRGKIWDSMMERNCEFEGESGCEGFIDEDIVEDGSSASEGGWAEAEARSAVPGLIKSDSAGLISSDSSDGGWGWSCDWWDDSTGEGNVEGG